MNYKLSTSSFIKPVFHSLSVNCSLLPADFHEVKCCTLPEPWDFSRQRFLNNLLNQRAVSRLTFLHLESTKVWHWPQTTQLLFTDCLRLRLQFISVITLERPISESLQGHWPGVRSDRCQRSCQRSGEGLDIGLSGQVSLCHGNSRLGNKKLQCYSQEEKRLSSETSWHLVRVSLLWLMRRELHRSAQVGDVKELSHSLSCK